MFKNNNDRIVDGLTRNMSANLMKLKSGDIGRK